MPRRMSLLLVASWLTLPGLALADEEELTPGKIAAIRRDEQAAQAKVAAANGHRRPSEMSSEERRQALRDQQAAGLAVMEKHGVSDKAYARRVARLTSEEREAVAREEKRLEAEKQKAAGEEARAPESIPIQRGFGDDNPVELEASEDAAPVVEQGLPPGVQGGGAFAAPPAKKKKRRKR